MPGYVLRGAPSLAVLKHICMYIIYHDQSVRSICHFFGLAKSGVWYDGIGEILIWRWADINSIRRILEKRIFVFFYFFIKCISTGAVIILIYQVWFSPPSIISSSALILPPYILSAHANYTTILSLSINSHRAERRMKSVER